MAEWVRAAAPDACAPGKLLGVVVEGVPVVLANVDGRICALRDECSHEAYPLSDGELDEGDLVCTYHGARFDACTGARKSLPAVRPVRRFPVDVRADGIYVDVADAGR